MQIVANTAEELAALMQGIKDGTISKAQAIADLTRESPILSSKGIPFDSPMARKVASIQKPVNKAAVDAAGMGSEALAYLSGVLDKPAKAAQLGSLKAMGGVSPFGSGPMGGITRFAASPAGLNALKIATGLGAVGGVIGAGDVLLGPDSGGNKLMDTAAMGIGGFLGAAGGPVGIAAGAGAGKAVSDGIQYLFGDKKTAEQRRMEEALAALGGRI